MRSVAIAALIGCVFFSSRSFVAKPGFNGGQSTHEIEPLIGGNNDLAELDVSLNNLYQTVLKNTPL